MDLSGIQFFELLFWHWWAIALILVVAEAMTPSGVFAGMALSAGLVGAVALVYPEMHWEPQVSIFGIGAVIFTIVWRFVFNVKNREESEYATRAKAKTYIGKEFDLVMPLQNGFGEIEMDGIHWELKGPDCKSGTRVRVVNLDGTILVVYPVPKKSDKESVPIETVQ